MVKMNHFLNFVRKYSEVTQSWNNLSFHSMPYMSSAVNYYHVKVLCLSD